jgi:hypothetical protein
MVQFAQSDHDRAQARYESACLLANDYQRQAPTRHARWQTIENNVVEGGLEALAEYEETINYRASKARCLAEFDGISIARDIIARAKARLEAIEVSK